MRALAANFGLEDQVAVYDGDTLSSERRRIRETARILITNPDMLHMGILPHHASWAVFFSNIEYVVVDELHTYRGVFGSHMANLIRRFNRVAAFYDSRPTFAACSATIANPRELAQDLTGGSFKLVAESGAPRGARTFTVYNPAVIDAAMGTRRSSVKEAVRLTFELVANGLTALLFCQSRRQVEIALHYLREKMLKVGLNPDRARGYRGGYLPTVRREIETAFKNGELDAVVATNALELGIDIGSLDAVVMAGYPGTVAGLRQRAGRAGRTMAPSLSVLVANASPLDQFLAREARYLVEASPERALVHPDNVEVLLSHLKCSVFELPFSDGERFGDLEAADTEAALSCLVDEGDVSVSKGRHYYIGESYPAGEISLRSISPDRIVVFDETMGEAISEVDMRRAKTELHSQAVYLSEGRTFFVDNLDLERKKAVVSEMEPYYYTQALMDVEVRVLKKLGRRERSFGEIATGDVVIKEKVTGFKKIKFHTHENLGYGQVSLPPEQMETEAFWLTPSKSRPGSRRQRSEQELALGFSGLGHSLQQAACLRLMCDPNDLAFAVQNAAADDSEVDISNRLPSLFFYDTHPGGVGLASKAFEEIDEMLEDVSRLIEGCGCAAGCPSCVGPVEGRSQDAKNEAIALARDFLERAR